MELIKIYQVLIYPVNRSTPCSRATFYSKSKADQYCKVRQSQGYKTELLKLSIN